MHGRETLHKDCGSLRGSTAYVTSSPDAPWTTPEIIRDHTEYMVLGIQLRNSEQMELLVSDSSYKSPEIFEFGMKGLG